MQRKRYDGKAGRFPSVGSVGGELKPNFAACSSNGGDGQCASVTFRYFREIFFNT